MGRIRFRGFPDYPEHSIYDELKGPRNGAFGLDHRFGCRSEDRPEDRRLEGMRKEWPAWNSEGITELPDKPTLILGRKRKR